MTEENLKITLALAQFILDQAELQVAAIRLFSSQFDLLLDIQASRVELSRAEDVEAAKRKNDQLADDVEQLRRMRAAAKPLLAELLSRSESQHEKIGHYLAIAKKSLRN